MVSDTYCKFNKWFGSWNVGPSPDFVFQNRNDGQKEIPAATLVGKSFKSMISTQ